MVALAITIITIILKIFITIFFISSGRPSTRIAKYTPEHINTLFISLYQGLNFILFLCFSFKLNNFTIKYDIIELPILNNMIIATAIRISII